MSGIFGFKNLELDINFIKNNLLHNHPDSFNYIQQDDITFCQSRIIIDSRYEQDYSMQSNLNMLAFNGEIYNLEELKEKYLSNDISNNFDVEVLIKLIEKYGLDILNKINGMFSFAYYDKRTGSTFLVNDRYSVKQLFYYISNNSFAFSSEDTILMRMLNIPFSFSKEYLNTLFVENIEDFQRKLVNPNIHAVGAGEYIEITKNYQINRFQYYKFNDFNIKNLNLNFKNKMEIVNYLEDLLTDAIKIRTKGCRHIAMTLSGGVDSSLIYTLSKERLNLDITPFSYLNNDSSKDEFKIAEKLSLKYNDRIVKVMYDNKAFRNNYKKAIVALNAPCCISDAEYYNVYKIINEMNYKVLLEGHGADELLGGYPFLYISAIQQAIIEKKYILALHIFNLYKLNTNKKINIKELINSLSTYKKDKTNVFLINILYLFRKKSLPKVLRYWDRMLVDNSVELRTPFLDYRVVEFLLKLPLEYQINKIGNKAILREILKKYKIDFVYKNKVKTGFTTSESQIINENKEFFLKYYDDERFNLDISNFDNQVYKACSVGFLENYYSK